MHRAQWSGTRGLIIGIALGGVVFSASAVGLPPGQTLTDAAFGDTAFVSVGTRGTIVSSINNGPWESRTSGTTNDLQAVAYGNGIFVAAGANGTLLSSSDGIDWIVRGTNGAWSKPDVAYGNGLFVVATKGPGAVWTMLVSSNGSAWVAINVDAVGPQNSAIPFGSIAFGEGKFLAIGGLHGVSLVVASTNGLIWREQGANIPRASSAITGPITYGNGKFAMVVNNVTDDDDDGGYFDQVLFSDDGRSWQGTSFGAGRVPAVLAADCAFVAATSYITENNIAYTRGNFWWTNIALPTAMSIKALAHGNGKFFAFGNDIMEFNVPADSGFAANPPIQEIPPGTYAYFWADPPVCPEPPVMFQWRRNGVPISGATNIWLQLSLVTTNDAGAYTLVAMNGAGLSVTSTVATLIVTDFPPREPEPPQIISPLTNSSTFVLLGSITTLYTDWAGWPRPAFQWRLNGNPIPGATNAYLTLYDVDTNAAGNYTVVASNYLGSAVSSVFSVDVYTSAPALALGLNNLDIIEGETLRFSLLSPFLGGPKANIYAFRDGTNTLLPISYNQFSLQDVSLADAGRYSFVASNAFGVSTGLIAAINVRPAGRLDRWTRRNPLPQNDSLLEVAHGNGRFVAVGERGAVVVSTNATEWSAYRIRAELSVRGIAFGNGTFVAVTDSSILSSTDGVTWSARINGFDYNQVFQTVAFGNGRFVAAAGIDVLISTDGVHWQDATLSSYVPRYFRAIAFGNSRFVAISDWWDYRVWTSPDGVTWSPVANGPGQGIEDLAFGNGLFVAVGDEGAVYTSPDGSDWTSRDSDVSNRLIDITYGNGRFVAVGTRGRIISSANGSTWRRETSGTPDRLEGVTFAGGLFIAVGENGTTLSSPNGVDWTKRNYGVTRDLDGIAVGNGTIAVVGKGGSIMTSTDGSNYIQRSGATANDLHGIGWADDLFVAVGEPETIVASPNAVQWTVRHLGTNSSLKAVTKGNDLWVAVGTGGAVLTSTDAATWVRQESYTLNDLNSIAYGNGLFVVVGDNLPPNGTMITSPDGVSWTRRNQYTGKNLRAVAFANGVFVATGNDGSILVSSNGLDWTPAPTLLYGNYAFNLRAITYAAGTWLVVGNEGLVVTSPNLQDWLVRTRQGIENLHGVVALNDRFVAIGNRGTIFQSEPYSPAGPILRGRFLGDGVELTVTGEPGTSVNFEHSPSLTGPWTPFSNYFFRPGSTTILMFDPTPTNSNTRFYRAVPR